MAIRLTAGRLKIAVIGAGWAGLTAAVELAAQGHQLTVFETSPHLGGRARGFEHKSLRLDNGQHILLGAYHQTLRLMELVGLNEADILLRLPLTLETPGHIELNTSHLPAPLHLLAGLIRAKGLGLSERLTTLAFFTKLRLRNFKLAQDQTVAELLNKQPDNVVRLLWEPLCIAALNTPISTASAQVFLNVLRDSFSHSRADSDMLLPRHDLSALFPQAAARYVMEHDGKILPSTAVKSLYIQHSGVEVDGEHFDKVICAVAPHQLATLLQDIPEAEPTLNMVNRFSYQPIATVYLQYASTVTLPSHMLGLSDGDAQWVFDRGTLCGQHGLIAASISTVGEYLKLGHDEVAMAVHQQLQKLIGDLPAPEWHQVIVEKRATFACVAGLQRPSNHTAHPHLFIAGDYTAGDYPATLEGAVRSGINCALLLHGSLA
ncbi:MAG TPA: hydroxysqualene dehydroxylase HpnE [Methylophilaceae bacterium]